MSLLYRQLVERMRGEFPDLERTFLRAVQNWDQMLLQDFVSGSSGVLGGYPVNLFVAFSPDFLAYQIYHINAYET